MTFKDIAFPETFQYSSDSEHIPLEFYESTFPIAKEIDLLLGYFSSNAFKVLSESFAEFIFNGGTIRIITNHIFSLKDKENLLVNNKLESEDEIIDIFGDIEKLEKELSAEGKHFFDCLKFLIKHNRLKILPVKFNHIELAHCKKMILYDGRDYISTDGSINFTLSALIKNSESFSVNVPWEGETFKKRINIDKQNFDKIFNKLHVDYEYLNSNQIESVINKIGRSKEIQDLLEDSVKIDNSNSTFNNKIKEILELKKVRFEKKIIELKTVSKDPRFPFPEGPREYQNEAYNSWIRNDFKGIFAMATGTGKTLTALNCVLNEYKQNDYYKVLIVVPTRALVMQWEQEVKAFNFDQIISTHSDKDWNKSLQRYITRSILDQKKNIILITTYSTFNREIIQSFINTVKGIESFIYIADEAHNIGSPKTLKNLPQNIKNRIGLSATPDRVYDEIGSKSIYDFFNSFPPKYTFRFTMKEAIDGDVLCKYDYFPIFIDLTSDEMRKYDEITKELRKYIDQETGKYKEEAQMKLLERKRIVHKAENKKKALIDLLEDLQKKKKLDYTFVFVPEGYEPDYSEIEDYDIELEDLHIIDEYAEIFKQRKYSYFKYLGGIEDSETVLKNFANGDIQVLLSMKCLDEGVDIPRAEHAIFCSSTGNPRQFVQRRGRVLRKSKGKKKAFIWDMIVTPPFSNLESLNTERNLFLSEVKRVVNFAALADNQIEILYGPLKDLCEQLGINLFDLLDKEIVHYN